MHHAQPTLLRLAWLGAILILTMVGVAWSWSQWRQARQPGVVRFDLELPLPDFVLTNQDGRPVTLADLQGKVWLADIIFSRCAGPCPRMSRRMREIQDQLHDRGSLRLVTLTTDPAFDQPPVLTRYGERFGAKFDRWSFLTGATQEIRRLAVDGLKLVATPKAPETQEDQYDLFIHSTRFVLVDRRGRMRAAYDLDDPQMTQRIRAGVDRLLKE